MKYSESNKPLVCMMTNSTCYKKTKEFTPKGVLWHSTGANNPNLKRYVQPSDNASDRDKLLKLLGTNTNKNDWNHIDRQAGLNAWIGKLADGTIAAVQTMPWNYRPWGCGSGSKGSCNNTHIQFEICEDSLNDKTYFDKVYKEACELTAYICDTYNLDPNGTTTLNGVKVPVILCHVDSYKLGLGSNHSDVLHWFNKYGKTMDDVRNDVAALMKKTTSTSTTTSTTTSSYSSSSTITTGAKLTLNNVALYSSATATTKSSSKTGTYYVWSKDAVNNRIRITNNSEKVGVSGQITGWINCNDAVSAMSTTTSASTATTATNSFTAYKVKVTADELNIRSGAGTSYKVNGVIKDKGVYTIIEEDASGKWGLLKSKAGWIHLGYTKKV